MFDLALDTDQAALVAGFERFFARECPTAAVRGAEPLGFSPALWARCADVGLPGMGAPEAAEGGGASMRDLCLTAEAAGAALAPIPFAEHTVAVRRHPDKGLVSGDSIGAVALHPAVEGLWRLVPAGAVADVVIGVDGDDLIAVYGTSPGEGPRNHGDAPLADRSTQGERVRLGPAEELSNLLVEWKILVAALLVGLTDRALEVGREYVKERHQFGRSVGGFQAVQHGLADCVALVEGARLLTRKAAWAFDFESGGPLVVEAGEVNDSTVLASMAFSFAAESACVTTKRALQYHGSYGFSAEYDIQLYYRRARAWPLAYCGTSSERRTLASLLWHKAGDRA